MGRPSDFSAEMADRVIEGLVSGKSLRTVCAAEDMPNLSTVIRWLADDSKKDFRLQYAHAREVQAEIYAAETIAIADDGSNDTYQTEDGEAVNHDVIARSRLRVDARKWYASKLAPKKYGDKLAVHGDDELPPVQHDMKVTLAADEAYKRMLQGSPK